MAETLKERHARGASWIGDGLFYGLMAFILVGTLGIAMGYARAEIAGAGWNAGIMIASIVAGIGGLILAFAVAGRPLPPPNTVKIEVEPAPTVPRSRGFKEPEPVTMRDVGVAVGAAAASVKETVTSAVETVAERTGLAESEAATAADAGEGTRPEPLAAPREGGPDDLKKIKGIGPKLEEMLHGLGYYHYDQIAAWTAEEIAWVDTHLEGFNGRATRDEWVPQARLLAEGKETEFSKRVDDGEVY